MSILAVLLSQGACFAFAGFYRFERTSPLTLKGQQFPFCDQQIGDFEYYMPNLWAYRKGDYVDVLQQLSRAWEGMASVSRGLNGTERHQLPSCVIL